MTEHARLHAEFTAWRFGETGRAAGTLYAHFEAGWLAAKADTSRLQQELAPEQKPLPTFDEWFMHKHACGFDASVYARKGLPYDQVMLLLSKHLREYVSEMVERR